MVGGERKFYTLDRLKWPYTVFEIRKMKVSGHFALSAAGRFSSSYLRGGSLD